MLKYFPSTKLHFRSKQKALKAPILTNVSKTESENASCQPVAKQIGQSGTVCTSRKDIVIVRWLRVLIDGELQRLVAQSMRQRILTISHTTVLAGHPWQRGMYHTMCRYFYYPNMAQYLYHVISNCYSYALNTRFLKNKLYLKWFPVTGPLELIAIGNLGPQPEISEGTRYVSDTSARYEDPTRAIPTEHITSTNAAYIFLNGWIIPFR